MPLSPYNVGHDPRTAGPMPVPFLLTRHGHGPKPVCMHDSYLLNLEALSARGQYTPSNRTCLCNEIAVRGQKNISMLQKNFEISSLAFFALVGEALTF